MDKIILFTGIYDLFGLRFINTLMEKSLGPVYCFSGKKEWNTLLEIVDSISCIHEREDLFHTMNSIQVVFEDIEELKVFNCKELFADKEISLWHLDKEVCIVSIYESQILSSNKKIMDNIQELCEKCYVSEVNYITSMYSAVEAKDDDNCTLLGKLQTENKRFLTEKFKGTNIRIKVYQTPLAFRQLKESDWIEAIDRFIYRLLEFKQWVNSRIPSYFDDNALTIFSGDEFTIDISGTQSIIDRIVEQYREESVSNIEILPAACSCSFQFDKLIKEISRNMSDIRIEITHNKETLNEIDLIFEHILSYHLPYLRLTTDSEKVIEQSPEAVKQSYMYIYDYIADTLKMSRNRNLLPPPAVNKNQKTIISQNGREFTYYTAGKGEAIIIVNAYGVSPDAWDLVIEKLSKNFYVIVWQTRGIYHKDKPNEDPSFIFGVEHQVEDIEEIVNNEGLKSFHIISWCSGIKSAMMYYQKHKEMIKSHILLAGEYAPYEGSKAHHSKFRENIQLIAKLVSDNEKMLDFYMRIIHNGMFNKPIKQYSGENDKYIYEVMPERHRDILLEPFTSKEKMVNFLNMCMEYYLHDITDLLTEVDKPVLFISAECDQIAPYKQSEWAHNRVENSNYSRLPGATHLMILERPEDVMERIEQHMKYYSKNIISKK